MPHTDDKTTQDGTTAVAKPKRHRNRPDLANFGQENIQPGDNARYLRNALVAYDLPPIDISDARQVEARIHQYFDFCVENDQKPSVPGMGLWLGVPRSTLNRWRNGDYRADTHRDLITKAVNLLEVLWIDWMQNGKVNPASGIFLGKNIFGYKDTQDIVLTPNSPLDDGVSPADIAGKYKDALPDADIVSD